MKILVNFVFIWFVLVMGMEWCVFFVFLFMVFMWFVLGFIVFDCGLILIIFLMVGMVIFCVIVDEDLLFFVIWCWCLC